MGNHDIYGFLEPKSIQKSRKKDRMLDLHPKMDSGIPQEDLYGSC